MTVFTLARELARDWGIATFTPASSADNTNVRGPSSGDLESIVFGINEALEEIWEAAPAMMFMRAFGAALRAPATVSVAVTNLSTSATITTWAAWMEGCTIRLGGDDSDNEIAYQNVLMRPYSGSTGTVSATVYADCVPFTESALTGSSGIAQILPPVRMAGFNALVAAGSRDDFYDQCGLNPYAHASIGVIPVYRQRLSGLPTLYFAENVNRGTAFTTHLRINPMPDTARVLEWNARIKPASYTTADINDGAAYNTDPGTTITLPFPSLILKTVARKCLSGDARFVNAAGLPEIARQHQRAIASLGHINPIGISARSSNALDTFRGSNRAGIFRG